MVPCFSLRCFITRFRNNLKFRSPRTFVPAHFCTGVFLYMQNKPIMWVPTFGTSCCVEHAIVLCGWLLFDTSFDCRLLLIASVLWALGLATMMSYFIFVLPCKCGFTLKSCPPTSTQPVLVLHGLLGSSRNFRSWINHLKESFKDFDCQREVICHDLRGHGKNVCLGQSLTYHEMTEDITDVL